MSHELSVSLSRRGGKVDLDMESGAFGVLTIDGDKIPAEERAGTVGSEAPGGESPEGLLADNFSENVPDAGIPAGEAEAADENASFSPEGESSGSHEQTEDMGSLIPQELLSGQGVEGAEASGGKAHSPATLAAEPETREEPASAQSETGQAEASQAAADVILEKMHDKGGE